MKILFIDGTSGFDARRLDNKPTGGIITSLSIIPRYLASHGHEVFVISQHPVEELYQGVHYLNKTLPPVKPEVVVWNRNAALMRHVVDLYKDAVRVWWLHDICQFDYLPDDSYKDMDYIVGLSDYNIKCYADFYGISTDKFVKITNGVDRSVFYPGNEPRNKNLWICATAPVKGLWPLKYIYLQLKRNNPNVELRLYCSQSLHDEKDDAKTSAFLHELSEVGIDVRKPVTQRELADVMRQAYAMLMPNSYPENCSNLLLQAQACGLPVITTRIGAAENFITNGVNGILSSTTPSDLFYWQYDLARLAVELHFNERSHATISRHAPASVQSWSEIGDAWNTFIKTKCLHQYSRNIKKTTTSVA